MSTHEDMVGENLGDKEDMRDATDPMLAVYVAQVDRTLIRENLKLTPDQRVRKMVALLRAAEEFRRAGAAIRTTR